MALHEKYINDPVFRSRFQETPGFHFRQERLKNPVPYSGEVMYARSLRDATLVWLTHDSPVTEEQLESAARRTNTLLSVIQNPDFAGYNLAASHLMEIADLWVDSGAITEPQYLQLNDAMLRIKLGEKYKPMEVPQSWIRRYGSIADRTEESQDTALPHSIAGGAEDELTPSQQYDYFVSSVGAKLRAVGLSTLVAPVGSFLNQLKDEPGINGVALIYHDYKSAVDRLKPEAPRLTEALGVIAWLGYKQNETVNDEPGQVKTVEQLHGTLAASMDHPGLGTYIKVADLYQCPTLDLFKGWLSQWMSRTGAQELLGVVALPATST